MGWKPAVCQHTWADVCCYIPSPSIHPQRALPNYCRLQGQVDFVPGHCVFSKPVRFSYTSFTAPTMLPNVVSWPVKLAVTTLIFCSPFCVLINLYLFNLCQIIPANFQRTGALVLQNTSHVCKFTKVGVRLWGYCKEMPSVRHVEAHTWKHTSTAKQTDHRPCQKPRAQGALGNLFTEELEHLCTGASCEPQDNPKSSDVTIWERISRSNSYARSYY